MNTSTYKYIYIYIYIYDTLFSFVKTARQLGMQDNCTCVVHWSVMRRSRKTPHALSSGDLADHNTRPIIALSSVNSRSLPVRISLLRFTIRDADQSVIAPIVGLAHGITIVCVAFAAPLFHSNSRTPCAHFRHNE